MMSRPGHVSSPSQARKKRRNTVLFAGLAMLRMWGAVFGWGVLDVPSAQGQAPSEPPEARLVGPDGLDGGRYVGSAFAGTRSVRLASTLGYAYTENVLGDGDQHHRISGELAVALVVRPSLQLAVQSELHYDQHAARRAGNDRGFSAGTRVASRHTWKIHPRVVLGAQTSFWFPGAESVGRGFTSLSPSLAALVGFRATPKITMNVLAGYRHERSEHAVRRPLALSRADRLAAGLASHDAALLGALFSYQTQPWTLGLELRWDVFIGGAASPVQSPLRLRASAQRMLNRRVLPTAELTLDLSQRPAFDTLVRIEPRVWGRVGIVVMLDRVAAAAPPPPQPAKPLSPPALLPITLQVLDENGDPIAGANVQLARSESPAHITDSAGEVELALPRGTTAVSIEKPGYEPQWQTLNPSTPMQRPIILARGLPASEIKGAVRNLAGEPLRAEIELKPLGVVAHTSEDGQFVMTVAPGHYTLTIRAEGFETQEREVTVELRGVTIVVTDLRRAAP